MEILFALLVLALLVLGVLNRKKSKREWIKEERHDESGIWIDKRSGERGTFGSLDEEMESNRKYIAKQAKVSELAQIMQHFCAIQTAEYQKLSSEKTPRFFAFCKSEADWLLGHVENFTRDQPGSISNIQYPPNPLRDNLKKRVLDFSFEHFPQLLELEIEQIKKFDNAAEQLSERTLQEMERLQN